MTTATITKRLDALEARRAPAVQVFVCWCPADEKHRPGCPAADAGDGDHVVTVRWEDSND